MAVCPKCGFQNDDQWRYCFKCGSVLPAADAPEALNTSANGESFAPANAEFKPDIFRVLAIVFAALMGISVFFPFMSLDLKIYKLPIRICDQSSFAALLVAGMGALAVWCAQNKKKWGVVAGGAVCLVVFLLAMSKANNAFSGKTYEFLSEMAEYYVDDIVDFLSGTVMDMVKKGFGYFGLLFSSIATILFGLLMPSDGFSFSNQDYGRMINKKWQNLKK